MGNVLGPPVAYIDLLNEATELATKTESEEGTNSYFPLRPSSSGKCTRELYYELMQFEKKAKYETKGRDAESTRLLALGGYVENHLIKQFERYLVQFFKVKYKQQVTDFYELSAAEGSKLLVEGSVDLCLISEKTKGVIDFKSKKDKFSRAFKTDWDDTTEKLTMMKSVTMLGNAAFWVDDLPDFLAEINDPFFEDNFMQLNGYACTEFMKKRGIDHGAIIQYNKNDSRLREVRFRPNDELFLKVKGKFQTVLDSVAAQTPPNRDYALGNIKCAFCSFSKECWNDDSLKAWFRSFPGKRWSKRIEELDDNEQLLTGFDLFEKHAVVSESMGSIEEKLCAEMHQRNLNKIKLENGHVYEMKALKNPDRLVLRRSKD